MVKLYLGHVGEREQKFIEYEFAKKNINSVYNFEDQREENDIDDPDEVVNDVENDSDASLLTRILAKRTRTFK